MEHLTPISLANVQFSWKEIWMANKTQSIIKIDSDPEDVC